MAGKRVFRSAKRWLTVLLALAAPAVARAQSLDREADAGTPIVFGQSYTLRSTVLGDQRRLNVWLPPGYGEGQKTYPVLVLLDGGVSEDFLHIAGLAQITSAYGRGQEFIVVGIEGVVRRHDLSPTTSDPADRRFVQDPGGATSYRRFLAEEVKPWITRRYRTDGRSAIMGESMAGLFVLDTFAATSNAFTDFIAVSPILWWDRGTLSKRIAAAPPATGKNRRLFIAFEGSMAPGPRGETPAQQAEARVDRALRGRPEVTIVRFDNERHDTIYHPAALRAFRTLYGLDERAK